MTQQQPPAVVTIGGSDSSGGAGVQIDTRVIASLGCLPLSVVTAVTAQNGLGVQRICYQPPRIVEAQIDALVDGYEISAVKIGMLGRSQTVRSVLRRLRRRSLGPVVIDPVLLSKNGRPLLTPAGLRALQSEWHSVAAVLTPNASEAEALTGRHVRTVAESREAARTLASEGCAVVIKGGHLEVDPVDVLYSHGEWFEFPGARMTPAAPLHGTGCIYASCLAACLALAIPLPEACARAQSLVRGLMARSVAGRLGSSLAPPDLSLGDI